MFQRFTSLGLALLLAGAALWGDCPSCPNVLPSQQQAQDCCARHQAGHCGAPSPKKPAEKPCKSLALAPEKATPVTVQLAGLVAPVPVVFSAPELRPEPVFAVHPAEWLAHPPPDLYLLNASLLV